MIYDGMCIICVVIFCFHFFERTKVKYIFWQYLDAVAAFIFFPGPFKTLSTRSIRLGLFFSSVINSYLTLSGPAKKLLALNRSRNTSFFYIGVQEASSESLKLPNLINYAFLILFKKRWIFLTNVKIYSVLMSPISLYLYLPHSHKEYTAFSAPSKHREHFVLEVQEQHLVIRFFSENILIHLYLMCLSFTLYHTWLYEDYVFMIPYQDN